MTVTHTYSGVGLSPGPLTVATIGLGDTPFDAVFGTVNIVAGGLRSPRIEIPAAGSYLVWQHGASRTRAAYRGYWTSPSSTPSSNVWICRTRQGLNGAYGLSLAFNSFGTVRLFGPGGVQVGVTNISLSLSTTYRFEFIVNHGNGSTTGTATFLVYSETGTLLDTVPVTGANFSSSHDRIFWGTDVDTTAMNPVYWDDLAMADTDTFIGDYVTPAVDLIGKIRNLATIIGSDIKDLQSNQSRVTMFPTGSEPDFTGVDGPQLWIEYTP